MDFKIIEETNQRMVFTLRGETHTFCNLLNQELQEVKGVAVATYKIDHPLVGLPEFLVETKGLEPRKALKEALKGVRKLAEEFKKEVGKL